MITWWLKQVLNKLKSVSKDECVLMVFNAGMGLHPVSWFCSYNVFCKVLHRGRIFRKKSQLHLRKLEFWYLSIFIDILFRLSYLYPNNAMADFVLKPNVIIGFVITFCLLFSNKDIIFCVPRIMVITYDYLNKIFCI